MKPPTWFACYFAIKNIFAKSQASNICFSFNSNNLFWICVWTSPLTDYSASFTSPIPSFGFCSVYILLVLLRQTCRTAKNCSHTWLLPLHQRPCIREHPVSRASCLPYLTHSLAIQPWSPKPTTCMVCLTLRRTTPSSSFKFSNTGAHLFSFLPVQ